MSGSLPLIGADEIAAALDRPAAVAAIEEALRAGQDVESDSPRLFRGLEAGEFLLMPAESPSHAGVKVATIAPGNPARGLPKIHAWYLLFEASTLEPVALLEGTYLTVLRTPAVTAAAVRALLDADPRGARRSVEHLVVFGTGPQAESHVRTLADILPVGRVSLIGRREGSASALVSRLRESGIDAEPGALSDALSADVVVTATSSSTPVVDLADVSPRAVVAAIGAHGPAHREVGADLVRAADLVVEARSSAYRESGNLLQARSEDAWRSGVQRVANIRELVADGITRRPDTPAVYAGVGMSWEDLAVVEKIMRMRRRL